MIGHTIGPIQRKSNGMRRIMHAFALAYYVTNAVWPVALPSHLGLTRGVCRAGVHACTSLYHGLTYMRVLNRNEQWLAAYRLYFAVKFECKDSY